MWPKAGSRNSPQCVLISSQEYESSYYKGDHGGKEKYSHSEWTDVGTQQRSGNYTKEPNRMMK